MVTEVYAALSEQERCEVRMYGATLSQLQESVEEQTPRYRTAPRMVTNIITECAELVEYADDSMVAMDIRQALNRASWIIENYCNTKEL
jgi:hypothetical protein